VDTCPKTAADDDATDLGLDGSGIIAGDVVSEFLRGDGIPVASVSVKLPVREEMA